MVCLLANNISFMRGFVPFLLILIPILCEIDSADCEQKGFSSSLLCSSCDKLSAFVGDSVEIVNECRACCMDDSSESIKKVKSARLSIHPYTLGIFNEVREFIDKYSNRYENLIINTRANVNSPRLQLVYENNKIEVIQIGKWKEQQLLDFCDSVLKKA